MAHSLSFEELLKILPINMEGNFSLYLHFPFCRKKCDYCAFYSKTFSQLGVDEWVASIKSELPLLLATLQSHTASPLTIETIYIGGGTPSLIPPSILSELVAYIKQTFAKSNIPFSPKEFSIEVNPGSLTSEFIRTASENSVSRITMGVQSFSERLRNYIGRTGDSYIGYEGLALKTKEIVEANMACGIDIITGIPTETVEEALQDIKLALQLPIQHISLYRLTPEEETPFWSRMKKDSDEEQMDDAELAAQELLLQSGFRHYEVSNFAKPGFESKHNDAYWELNNYIGLGTGAVGMFAGDFSDETLRFLFEKGIADFCSDGAPQLAAIRTKRLANHLWEIETISASQYVLEMIMMGLRRDTGIENETMRRRIGTVFENLLPFAAHEADKQGWLAHIPGHFALNEEGRLFLNRFLLDVMDELDCINI